jgi:GT2 family glycosyltransferase/Flp pilus assembly protein TadD/FMN phosphatase YigB (HAD superfamily)/glycosyltransferase involved in cell wall biosynthesis
MKTIAALLPTFGKGSGGVRTVLNNLSALATNGFECHIYVEGNATDSDLRECLHQSYGCDNVIPHAGCRLAQDHDMVIATMWHTALALGAMPGSFKKVYLAQDYEPFFYPMGGHYVMAEHSYAQGLHVITMGRWLAEKLRREFGLAARVLDFCADLGTYCPRPEIAAKEFAVAVIHQPEKPHRATQTVLSALQLVRSVLPHLKVFTFGSETGPASPATHHLGILSPARLNDLYNRCLAGVCISMTNPSRVPFEMMAAGLPVIEAHRENNLFDLPPDGVVRATLAAESLKEAIIDLIIDESRLKALARAGAAFMQKRPARLEQEQFCQHIHDIFQGAAPKTLSLAPVKAAAYQRPENLPGNARCDLLTVDVWDTLLRRRCHPDEIKLFTAHHLLLTRAESLKPAFTTAAALVVERVRCEQAIGRQRSRTGLDDEYSIHEVFEQWLASVLARLPSPQDLSDLAGRLVALEVEQEKRCFYPDTNIAGILEKIPAKRRLFLSDFYMPASTVKEFIAHAGLSKLVPDGIVSCDQSLNKRTGRLFRKIQEDTGTSPTHHVHIGDSEYSDYFIPRKLGMNAIHYGDKEEWSRIDRFKREYRNRDGNRGFAPEELSAIARLRPDECDLMEDQDAMRRLGAAAAPLLVGFTLFVAEEAVKRGLPKLYFFTREGEFFARLYAELAKHEPFGAPFPEPVIVEVSRLATFAASLERFDLAEFMRLWNLYSSQSLKSFFTSLDLDPAPLSPLFRTLGLALDEVIRFPWTDPRVRKLFANERFTQTLARAGAEKRALLLDYLKTRGIRGDEDKVGVVDIGWRGTIQDNLAWVLNRTKIHGWYFGLLPFLNVQPPNATKSAFGPGRAGDSPEVQRLLDFVSPLEMLCNSQSGSTLRYERRDGTVVAQREKNPREEQVFNQFTRHFQDGVISQVGPIAELVRQRAIASTELRPLALDILSHIIHDPPRAAATAYFTLNHNETFGTGEFDDKQRHCAQLQAIRLLYENGELDAFEQRIGATTWPQGFVRLCGVRYPFFHATPSSPTPLPVERKRVARQIAEKALDHYRKAELDQARRLALESLALDPWRLKMHYLAYRVCLRQGRTKAAMQHFRLIRTLNPKHPPTFNEFALRSHLVGFEDKSEKVFETLVQEQPDYLPAVLNLGRAYLHRDKPVEALALLEKHRERFAGDGEFQSFLAFARVLAGHAILAAADTQLTQPSSASWAGAPALTRFCEEWRKISELAPARTAPAGEIEAFVKPLSDDEYLGIDSFAPIARSPAHSNAGIPANAAPSAPKTPVSQQDAIPQATHTPEPHERYWLKTYESFTASTTSAEPSTNDASPAESPNPVRVSIVIPVFNKIDFTRQCLQSVRKNTPAAPYEILVVDNGSSDGTTEYLKAEEAAGRLRLLRNSENLGFARACNQGARAARGKYILFLNNDTEVQPGWLQPLVSLAEADPAVAAVGGKLLFPNGTIQHAGVAIGEFTGRDPLLAVHAFYKAAADLPAANERRVYQALTAACALVRKSAFDAVGGFDEGFWNGYEDVDLCLRFQDRGWLMVYEPASVVVHHESQSGPARFQKVQDNIRRLHQKWLGKAKLDLVLAADGTAAPAETSRIRPYEPAAAAPFTSIIILAHNQMDHTRRCLESIVRHTPEHHELILVDNGSSDGTLEYFLGFSTEHDNVRVIANRTNRGFAAGNNQGLAIARGSFVLMLNNDTVVTPGWLAGMLAVFEAHPRAGIAGPRSNCIVGKQLVEKPGYRTLDELPAFASEWAKQHADQSQPANRVIGFCLLSRRAVCDALGSLDEQFGSGNFEDDDFCIRAGLAGFETRIADAAFVHHVGSATFNGARIDYRQAMLANWALFKRKWGIPAEQPPQLGYLTPKILPPGVSLKIPAPELAASHEPAADGRCWREKGTVCPTVAEAPRSKPQAVTPPSCAGIGNLAEARELLRQKNLQGAWTAATAAIQQRPFHPEAALLLAEIALASGDSISARQAAQHASGLAPGWKAPKQFLQKSIKGNTRPEWLVLPPAIANRLSAAAHRLTVCVITKNEEQFLDQCLKSVKDVAAQIVVVDTGSTDRTLEIAKSHGAEVHHFDWCDDFSAARNATLEHATGNWILVLDADEELPADQHARLKSDLKNAKAIACRLPLVNKGQEAEGVSYIPRLFRNAPGAFFHGRIHEQIFSSLIALSRGWGLQTGLGSAQLLHHGYNKEILADRHKIERNLRLLRQAVQESPNDPNLIMNLGLELVRSGDLANGLAQYRESFRLMSAQAPAEVVPELREALLTQFTCHLYKQREHAEIARVLNSPLAKNGTLTASLCFALGLSCFELKQYREAAEQMRRCLLKRKESALSPLNADILTAAPQHCLALSLAKLGDAAGAEKTFEAALKENGRIEDVKLDYARFLGEQNRQVDALRHLHEIVAGNSRNKAAWRLGGDIALSRQDYLEFARDWTGEAIRCLPEDPEINAQRAEVLMLSGETADARPFWGKACSGARPPRALAALILCDAAEFEAILPMRSAEEEAATSQAFVQWYQRMLSYGAHQTIERLNSRLDALSESLPTAAQLLDSALSEARAHVT